MKKIRPVKLLILSCFWVITLGKTALAVMPPDFIVNVGTQIAQIASIVALFLSTIFSVSYQFIKTRFSFLKTKTFWILSVAGILVISISAAYFYSSYKQNKEYELWLRESETYTSQESPVPRNSSNKLILGNNTEQENPISRDQSKFISSIEENSLNENSRFIEEYYSAIANQEFEKAYSLSKKSVDLETFKSWYKDTTKIIIDKITEIDDTKSSLELTLYEGSKYTRYGVLITLKIDNGKPIAIEKSEVKTLGSGIVETEGQETKIAEEPSEEQKSTNDFFTTNKNTPLSISNQNFEEITTSNRSDYVVLDARENIEYENGYFEESLHIRYADLQAGRWIELPNDKFIYVICWSGIRGKEVAEFLRTKNIVASYLETGANGWVEYGGAWIGNIKFAQKYSEERYRLVFSTEEIKDKLNEGVILVDSREPWKYEESHIEGSINIPMMYTPTIDLEKVFGQVPKNSKVITVCDGYVNCFDAKITGVELELRGYTFLGRYNKPWEF